MESLSKQQLVSLIMTNRELMAKTGINFMEHLFKMAKNHKEDELTVKNFLKDNYPRGIFGERDCYFVGLLLGYYNDNLNDEPENTSYRLRKEIDYNEINYNGKNFFGFLCNRSCYEISCAGDFFPEP